MSIYTCEHMSNYIDGNICFAAGIYYSLEDRNTLCALNLNDGLTDEF